MENTNTQQLIAKQKVQHKAETDWIQSKSFAFHYHFSISWWVLADKQPSSMQATCNTLDLFCFQCRHFIIITLLQPPANLLGNTHLSLIHIHNICPIFRLDDNQFHTDCQEPLLTTFNQLGKAHFPPVTWLLPAGYQVVTEAYTDWQIKYIQAATTF